MVVWERRRRLSGEVGNSTGWSHQLAEPAAADGPCTAAKDGPEGQRRETDAGADVGGRVGPRAQAARPRRHGLHEGLDQRRSTRRTGSCRCPTTMAEPLRTGTTERLRSYAPQFSTIPPGNGSRPWATAGVGGIVGVLGVS